MRRGWRCNVGLLLALAPLAAQTPDMDPDVDPGAAVPPPFLRAGVPNPTFGEELEAKMATLRPDQRAEFFRLLRREQRALARRLEAMLQGFDHARALDRELAGQNPAASGHAHSAMEAQREAIQALRAIARDIQRLRARQDSQRLDALDFQADFYAGLTFSSLYSEGELSKGFFSTSKPFVALDLRNRFQWPGQDRWMELFGTLSFQAASKENSDAVNVITTSGNFRGEMGVWWMHALTEEVSYGILGRVGLVGYGQDSGVADLDKSRRDEFRNTYSVGVTLRQEEGPLRNSVAEIAYVKDPLFLHKDRLQVRGQVILTQFGSRGSSGDFYMEGRASKGRKGRDEVVLVCGVRLSTTSFFRSLGGN